MIKTQVMLVISALLLLTTCSKDNLYDFLLGPQPNFIDKQNLAPGLNIFGIIRPDSVGSTPMSVVHVEKVVLAINETDSFSFEMNDAQVMVYRLNNGSVTDSIPFIYNKSDSMFSMYRPIAFRPQAGEQYQIICRTQDLPDLTAETIVPEVPTLEHDTIFIDGNQMSFTIVRDTSAAMYDVYLFTGNITHTQRIMRPETGNTPVKFEFDGNITANAQLTIYAYDKNLAEYFTAANVFFKPNTYRPPFSKVDNGYGCFGSLNIFNRKL